MAEVFRASCAEHDLVEIWKFFAADDPAAADRMLNRIDAACELLADHPRVGQSREDLLPGLRFLPIRNYLIFYRICSDGIYVVRVIHGAMDYAHEDFWRRN